MNERLIIIGLDGATWRVISPLIEQEKLPNMKHLVEKGTFGVLQSTFPPITGPAWTSIASGKGPGKTGIFDFFNRTSQNSYELRSINSTSMRKAGAIWDYLSVAGIKVGIYNYPFLYPPYPINGFMASGLGSSIKGDITYPKELKQQLFRLCGGYRIEVLFRSRPYANNPSRFVKDCLELLEINEKALKFVQDKYAPTMLFAIISATDFAQHYMWKFIDKTHPLYDEKQARLIEPLFVSIWQKVDQILGDVMLALGDEGDLLIVSDHGFGPTRGTFYLRRWLEEEGYLTRTSWGQRKLYSTGRTLLDNIGDLDSRLNSVLSWIFAKGRSLTVGDENSPQDIVCIGRRSAGQGALFINSPKVRDKVEVSRIKHDIMRRLKATCASLSLRVDFYEPHSYYSGRNVGLAPDILFAIDNFGVDVRYEPSNVVYKTGPDNPRHNGDHRLEGLFLAYGPDIKQGAQIEGAKIYDIAPTVLHMFGLPVPDDMDGKVLTEIFREGTEVEQRDVVYRNTSTERERIERGIARLKKRRHQLRGKSL